MSRGRKLTVQGAAKNCAMNVIFHNKERGFNWRYQMRYFGDAMVGHLRTIKEKGLDMSPAVARKIEAAVILLKEECDGKDCSFQQR